MWCASPGERAGNPIPPRVLAAWPALTPLVAFVIAEMVQLVQHGADGFHRATLLNGLVYLVGVAGIIGATGHLLKRTMWRDRSAGRPGARSSGRSASPISDGRARRPVSHHGSDFWLATMIVSSIFLLGAAAGHVKQMIVAKNSRLGMPAPCSPPMFSCLSS